jgi:eukaryotic-like serine/threonine-protein kinase
MTPEQWERVSEIFENALSLDGAEREAYLREVCAEDPEFRDEVDSLLASHQQAGSGFLSASGTALEEQPGKIRLREVQAGRRIGPYLVEQKIGHGGMGEVFAASRADGQFEKKVALKLVRSGYDTSFILERFRTERQILANLDHPNIARLLDGGTTEDTIPYLVMELVEGVSIDSYCDAHKLSVTERLLLFRQVCAAVQYAHQRLVIHRDIKPSNILVTKEGVPKLLDFGIAKILDASGSTEATMLRPMTPEYASPEQVRGEPISTSSDVYSLGVVLYQLLTGRSPYRVETHTPAKLVEAITHEEPERPSTSVHRTEAARAKANSPEITPEAVSGTREASPLRLQKRLRGDLDFILLKALRKEPAERYPSVEQFSEDLRRHLEGVPVAARKGTWTYRSGKFIRKHKASVAAAALVFATLVAAVVVTLREARIAQRHFTEVRKLANSLIFEIHDSILDLPGATKARKLILQRSLEYLDGLAKDSGNDPDLLRELATAYGRIGSLQGNPMDPNLGDTKAALASFQKSMAMRESLAHANPKNSKDQLELAVAYLDYSDLERGGIGNASVASDYCKKALAILDREVAAFPNDIRTVAQSTRGYSNLGMIEIGEGPAGQVGIVSDGIASLRKALTLDQHAIELAPSNPMFPGQEAVIRVVLADAEEELGERSEALVDYQHGLEILDSLNSKGDNIRSASNAALVKERIGDVLLSQEKLPEALAEYTLAKQSARKLLAADPQNQLLHGLVIGSSAQVGHALAEAGRSEEALRDLREALEMADSDASKSIEIRVQQVVIHAWIAEASERSGKFIEASKEYIKCKELIAALIAAGVNDLRMQGYSASANIRLANTLIPLGRTDDAGKEYAESLSRLEPLARANPGDQGILYALAETYTGEGNLSNKLAALAPTPAQRLQKSVEARDWYQKSISIWATIHNPARFSTSGVEATLPDEVSRRLAHCNQAIKSLEAASN